MSYLLLGLPFLGVAVAAGIGFTRRRGSAGRSHRRADRLLHWRAAALAAAALLVLTAVFDSLMIGAGLFHYAPDRILGARVGLAPVEDFAYPLAAIIALPALWSWLREGDRSTVLRALLRRALVVSRPVSWVNTAFPFGAAMLLTTREIDWLWCVGVLYYLIPYNLAMYGINDVYDYESDRNNPRKGGVEGALLEPRLHRPLLLLIAAGNLPVLLVLCAAGGPAAWAAIAVSTFAVIAYSAQPLRFKEIPVLDSLTSSVHFVSPAVVGLALAGAEASPALVLSLLAFLLWGAAAHAFGAVQDIGPDRAAGISSVATALGARRTVRLSLALWLASGAVMLATPWPGPLAALVAVPYLLNAAPWWRIDDDGSARSNRAWRRFMLLNYVSGFLVTLILILVWRLTS
ncbi:prenyltransferase [Leucobacter weissii]|uniref:Prenyltransferase n=1 Tax=Leucobacter weissii TaxID=1983706 RepID=A0A939MPE2_9MICO|nr:prenyltransferase [Leucobacter weissii]MBO1902507.1 prenyltransferase [Leucobacter weissii]